MPRISIRGRSRARQPRVPKQGRSRARHPRAPSGADLAPDNPARQSGADLAPDNTARQSGADLAPDNPACQSGADLAPDIPACQSRADLAQQPHAQTRGPSTGRPFRQHANAEALHASLSQLSPGAVQEPIRHSRDVVADNPMSGLPRNRFLITGR
jgi:hypothetical protein